MQLYPKELSQLIDIQKPDFVESRIGGAPLKRKYAFTDAIIR